MANDPRIQEILDRLDRPVVLVGMPASGKTSLGRGMAGALNLPFIDIDQAIVDASGQAIATLFAERGEEFFRDLESETLARVFRDHTGACVISTGGGAVLRPQNAALLFGKTHSVWVRASVQTLLNRTAHDTHRPLLKNTDPEKTLRHLESVRNPLYRQAAIMVETDGRPVEQIIPDIIESVRERLFTS